MTSNLRISVIGLGYVGLPLAIEFSKKYVTIGFDISEKRINDLLLGVDQTKEIDSPTLKKHIRCSNFKLTSSPNDIGQCDFYIITVPTPIDESKRPDLSLLLEASKIVGRQIKKESIVIYESTVYPGATEEECVPVLEQYSQMKFNSDFFCGYSPERVNPGDKIHTLSKITKVTSGSTKETALRVDNLYKSIIEAGTYLAPSIKVAEAAKVIENSQRDINIAFVNELATIFSSLGIDTHAVLEVAATKWNFMTFKPGLVGGHCIGVDPYYLAHKAQQVGIIPHIILSGRKINDSMGVYIANQTIKLMIRKGEKINGARVLVLGVTFKENCPDVRNSGVFKVVKELMEFGCNVNISDPWANVNEVRQIYNMDLIPHQEINFSEYQAIVLAVAHEKYKNLNLEKGKYIIYDVKGILKEYDERL